MERSGTTAICRVTKSGSKAYGRLITKLVQQSITSHKLNWKSNWRDVRCRQPVSAPLTNPNMPFSKSSIGNITPSIDGSSHTSDQSCLGGIRVIQVVKSATWEVLLGVTKVPSRTMP